MILLAFHVDYWDYLGWPDRFAQSRFTRLQRQLAAHNQLPTIYTPQLALQGRDFRQHNRFRQMVDQINRTRARATITLSVTPHSRALQVATEAAILQATDRPTAELFIALYENNLISKVAAGENAGKTLHHDFVVRKWLGPFAVNAQGHIAWQQHIPLEQTWKRNDIGVVACLIDARSGDVLQAVTLALSNRLDQSVP